MKLSRTELEAQLAKKQAQLDELNGILGELSNTPAGAIIDGLRKELAEKQLTYELAMKRLAELDSRHPEHDATVEEIRAELAEKTAALQQERDLSSSEKAIKDKREIERLTLQLATARKLGDDLYEALYNAPEFAHEPDCSFLFIENPVFNEPCDCGTDGANNERKERLENWSSAMEKGL